MLLKWLLDQSSTGKGSRDKSALEILRERYARGEINPARVRAIALP